MSHYERALRDVIQPGDVVVDLASGTGILGMLACRAGAARVYAVEAGPIAGLAREIARANGFSDRITVIHAHSSEVTLPERADLVVSDQIGRFGVEAGVLPLFADARARLLKPGGRLVPSRIDLVIAPVEYRKGSRRVAYWSRRPARFDFTPAHRVSCNTGYPARFAPSHLLAAPRRGIALDLAGPAESPMRIKATFEVTRSGTLDGVGGWFEAQLSPAVAMTNSPLSGDRIIRRQAFFPIASPIAITTGDRIEVAMRILAEEVVVAWTVTVHPPNAQPVSTTQSTLNGMLLDAADVRMTDPGYRPILTERGTARRTVLELCDARHTLAEIEAEVFARHRSLFASNADAATFVAEVVTRYTTDAG